MTARIALVGRAGSGKTTIAEMLVRRGMQRHALANPLKVQVGWLASLMLAIDERHDLHFATVGSVLNIMRGHMGRHAGAYDENQYARDLAVRDHYIDFVTKHKPNFRGVLQYYGSETIRDLSAQFGIPQVPWVTVLLNEVATSAMRGFGTVVDDARFPDEVAALQAAGFVVVRVHRPEGGDVLTGAQTQHISEAHWAQLPADIELYNTGDLDALTQHVAATLISGKVAA